MTIMGEAARMTKMGYTITTLKTHVKTIPVTAEEYLQKEIL